MVENILNKIISKKKEKISKFKKIITIDKLKNEIEKENIFLNF